MTALYPSVAAVADLQLVHDDPLVAAIVVATHAPSHFEVAEAALRAGVDIFDVRVRAVRLRDVKKCDLIRAMGQDNR